MDARQKLEELLRGCVYDSLELDDDLRLVDIRYENIADHLIANGVTVDVRQKLVELLRGCVYDYVVDDDLSVTAYIGYENIADYLIAHGVTVQERGSWKYYHKQNKAVCTNCSFERDLDANFGNAITCPNCGAKMDGGNEDA